MNKHVAASNGPKGFTLIELLVVVAIISLLVTILMPSLQKAKDLARNVVCMSNQKALCMATCLYTQDFSGYYPHCSNNTADTTKQHPIWTTLMDETYGTSGLRYCPSQINYKWTTGNTELTAVTRETDANTTAGIAPNDYVVTRNDKWITSARMKLDSIKDTARLMLVVDNDTDAFAGGWRPGEHIRFRHFDGNGINLGFIDSHVETWQFDGILECYIANGRGERLFSTDFLYYPWGDSKE